MKFYDCELLQKKVNNYWSCLVLLTGILVITLVLYGVLLNHC